MKESSPDTSDLPVTSLLHGHNYLTLLTSAKQRWDPRSVPKETQWITGKGFWISLQSDWQIDKAFLTRQSWPVLKSWYKGEGPEQGFWHCFTDRRNQSLVLSVPQVTCYLPKLLLFTLFTSPSTLNFQQEQARKPISTGGSPLQKNLITIYMLRFNSILGLNFIFLCFGVWKCMVLHLKQREIKIKPRIKLSH